MNLDQETIRQFQELAKKKTEVRLINVFKGLPISYPAFIQSVESDTLLLKTERIQVVCLYRDRETYIQSPLPKMIHGFVKDLNVENSEAILHNFKFVDNIGIRANVRVEPQDRVIGAIVPERRDLPINCELADISQDGLGLFIDQDHYSPVYFAVGQAVIVHVEIPLVKAAASSQSGFLSTSVGETESRFSREELRGIWTTPDNSWLFSLPTSSATKTSRREIALTGLVVNAHLIKPLRRYRTGIKLNPSDPQRGLIGQFIVQRQSEIINELRQVANSLTS